MILTFLNLFCALFRVITGVRFTKVKQMFHLQAEEGELGPRGAISESSRQWIQVPGSEFSYRNKTLKDGVDYHTLTYEARTIDIDNVIAPENMVVTGDYIFIVCHNLNT